MFFDAIAKAWGGGGVDAQAGDQVPNKIPTRIDGMNVDVFIIGVMNRPDQIDSGLLHFGEYLYSQAVHTWTEVWCNSR